MASITIDVEFKCGCGGTCDTMHFTYFEEQLSKDWGITAPDRRFKIDQIFDGDLIKYEYTTGLLIYWGTEEEYIQIDMSNQRDVVTELRKKLKEEEENLKRLEERRDNDINRRS